MAGNILAATTPATTSATTLQTSQLLPLVQHFPKAQRWVVAYSGGVDSHVLLHLCHQFLAQQASPPELLAIHINHQLQTACDAWAEHCQQQVGLLGVELTVVPVSIAKQPQKSLEELARLARYQVFEQVLHPGDVLLQGHHANDQAETVMLRLLRGSGSRGLAAMPQVRALGVAHLYRPLLNVPRSELEAYAVKQSLNWVEDPSNQSTEFDRNYLRSSVMPLLHQRWPQCLNSFARAARLSAESAQLNRDLAEIDLAKLGSDSEPESGAGLCIDGLKRLSEARCKNLLRYWLELQQLPLPTEVQLKELIVAVIAAGDDAQPKLTWPGVEAYRFNGELRLQSPLPNFDNAEQYRWDMLAELTISGAGRLSAQQSQSTGLKFSAGQTYEVRFRQGGEVCRPAGRGGSRKLKKLLQELSVPYWLRDRVPLIYCGDELVAVADLLVAEGWQLKEGEQGLCIHWHRPS